MAFIPIKPTGGATRSFIPPSEQQTQEPIQFKSQIDTGVFGGSTGISTPSTTNIFGTEDLVKAAGGFAKDVGQSIARSLASTVITLTKNAAKGTSLENADFSFAPEDFQSFFGQELVKNIFGSERNLPIEDRIAETELKVKDWQTELNKVADTPGLNTREKLIADVLGNLSPQQVSFVGVMGSIGLDLTPFGGEKGAFKALVEAKTEGDALIKLAKMGVDEDVARRFAKDVVNVSDEASAKKLFTNIAKFQEKTTVARTSSFVNPATRAIETGLSDAEKLQAARDQVDFLTEYVSTHPGKDLVKYSSDGVTLPEVSAGKISKFGRSGDSIAQEALGSGSSYKTAPGLADAQKALDEYNQAKKALDDAKTLYKDIKASQTAKVFDTSTYADNLAKEAEKYKTADEFVKAKSPALDYIETIKKDDKYKITKAATGGDEDRAIARIFQQRIDEGKVPERVLNDFYSKTAPAVDMEVGGIPKSAEQGVRGSHIMNFYDNPQIAKLTDFYNRATKTPTKVSREGVPLALSKRERAIVAQRQAKEEKALTEKARQRVEALAYEMQLSKWENVREALRFPELDKMSSEQWNKLGEILSSYKQGDEFLTTRQLQTVDRTQLTGMRTTREVRAFLAKKYNMTEDQLPGIKPHPWMYDTQLARSHPLFDLMVKRYNVSYTRAVGRVIELERKSESLIKAARASRKGGLKNRLGQIIAPTDERVVNWLESDAASRQYLQRSMTEQEVAAAKFMDNTYREYYDWLSARAVSKKFESRFEDKYFPHTRRGFLETWKEDGFLRAFKEQLDQFKQEERMLTILDQKTGDVLPYEKWVGFAQFRDGGLTPTKNAARAFKTYITALEKARQFDEFIPEIMTYVHSLTPKGLTQRGIEVDDSLKRFVKTWINSKKGRTQQQIVKPGGRMDWALRMGVTLTRIRDLGLNIPVGIANMFGEQAGTLTMLGSKDYAIGSARYATKKGRAITARYPELVGQTFWEKLASASNSAGDKLLAGMYGIFGVSSRKANQIFLLGSMTPEEFASGKISVERLAELRNRMGEYRVVEGAESVFGKSAEAAVGGQYKKWAIPILVSTKDNAATLAKMLAKGDVKAALSSKEGSQLFYSTLLGAALGLGTMGYYNELKDKKDRNFIEDVIFKSTRDSLSMIGALDPQFLGSFAAPRLASFFVDLGQAIDDMLLLERYKDSGELKGPAELGRLVKPSILNQIQKTIETPPAENTKQATPVGLPPLPSVSAQLPKLPSLPKI